MLQINNRNEVHAPNRMCSNDAVSTPITGLLTSKKQAFWATQSYGERGAIL